MSTLSRERGLGVTVLRALPMITAAERSALNAAQVAWVDQLLDAPAALPRRRPRLPDLLRRSAFPPVLTRDGAHALSEAAVDELVRWLKALPAEGAEGLLRSVAPYDQASLSALAGVLFRQWLSAGAPPKEKWAMWALGHFPSDAWAAVLGGLAQQWSHDGFAARAQEAILVLGRMQGQAALGEVLQLANRARTSALRTRARQAFEDAAQRLGLSVFELEDRLFPPVVVPEGATVSLDTSLNVSFVRDGAPVPSTGELKHVSKALRAARGRLERLMVDGPALSGVHFTETWLMHPVLRVLAGRVVWALLRAGRRDGLFVPGSVSEVIPDEASRVRPVHPTELTRDELTQGRAWIPTPAFVQLDRACFPVSTFESALHQLEGRHVTAPGVLALERRGWERGPVDGDGMATDFTRRGTGWSVTLRFDPGLWPMDPLLHGDQSVALATWESSQPLSARVMSEIQRDVKDCLQ